MKLQWNQTNSGCRAVMSLNATTQLDVYEGEFESGFRAEVSENVRMLFSLNVKHASTLEAAKLEAVRLLKLCSTLGALEFEDSEPPADCELDGYDKLAWEMTRNRAAKLAADPNRALINDRAHAQACAAVSLLAEELRTTGYNVASYQP